MSEGGLGLLVWWGECVGFREREGRGGKREKRRKRRGEGREDIVSILNRRFNIV